MHRAARSQSGEGWKGNNEVSGWKVRKGSEGYWVVVAKEDKFGLSAEEAKWNSVCTIAGTTRVT